MSDDAISSIALELFAPLENAIMQTFSIATQQFAGFSFGVDPANTAIVTFSYPDPVDATRVLTARFNRNGMHLETVEPPVVKSEPVPLPPEPPYVPPLPYTDEDDEMVGKGKVDSSKPADAAA